MYKFIIEPNLPVVVEAVGRQVFEYVDYGVNQSV